MIFFFNFYVGLQYKRMTLDDKTCQQITKNSSCIQKLTQKVNKLKKKRGPTGPTGPDPALNPLPYVNVTFSSATGPLLPAEDETIIYDMIISDDNSLYDPNTGCVTIQEDGTYLVNFFTPYFLLGTGTASIRIDVLENNITLNDTVIQYDGIRIIQSTSSIFKTPLQSSVILDLVNGDKLKIVRDESFTPGTSVLIGQSQSGINNLPKFQVKKLL